MSDIQSQIINLIKEKHQKINDSRLNTTHKNNVFSRLELAIEKFYKETLSNNFSVLKVSVSDTHYKFLVAPLGTANVSTNADTIEITVEFNNIIMQIQKEYPNEEFIYNFIVTNNISLQEYIESYILNCLKNPRFI